MNKKRCGWELADPLMIKYHDEEWGVPNHDDRYHLEALVLDGFQAGLSWRTILNKRENFRKAFNHFDAEKVAAYKERKINALLKDKGIVRNQQKINAAVNNARLFLELQKEFGSFDDYIWHFTNRKSIINEWPALKDIPPSSPLSDKVSKDLKKRGFKFVGTTIIYAYLQTVGIVIDHTLDCFRRKEILTSMKTIDFK